MSNTGVRRKVDDLGRVVIPAGIRKSMDIQEGESLEFHVEGDRIVLTRATDRCILCGHQGADLREVHERRVCPACIRTIRGLPGAAIHDEHGSPRPVSTGHDDGEGDRRRRVNELDRDARRLMAVARGRRIDRDDAAEHDDDPGRTPDDEGGGDPTHEVYDPASTTAW